MDKRLIAANALSFFSMVIVYQAFLTVASPLSAIRLPFSLMQLNLWFMFVSLFGVLLFAYTFHREPERDVTRLLHISLAVNGLSVLALAAGLAGKTVTFFLYIGGLLFPLACGYLDGCLFYILARHTVPRRQGIAIGLYIAITNGLLFLVQRLVERATGEPLFFPWPLLLVALALIAILIRPVPTEETAQPVVPQTQVSDHLPLFCGIGILLSLLIGLSSTLDFVEYEEYYRNWHAISRLFLAAGYLAAGWLADHYPVWLPVAALLAKVAVFAAYTFVLEGAPLWFTIFADAFFSPFIILFIIWMFFNVALRSTRPELWAGMGRAIERPFHVLGALAGEMLLEHKVSHGVMSLVYMGLLILAVVLLYRLFLLYAEAWKHSVESEADARVKAETASFANAGLNAAKNTKTLANAEISAQASADYFVETVEADNKKDTTATETITAVSADFFDNNQLEMVADETETSELFTTEIAEDATAVKIISAASADNSENQEDETAAEKEEAKQDDSQPNDSGPLHGDRLRKYQLRYRLTNRETEVLWEILQKHKTSEIAANLFITVPTAKYHISNILQKTGAQNQRELRYMIQKDES
ncbi:DNA-binding transcriptional regulator, CsgD family [Succiniclasticum ruminis]|uniref:DNA-binding transcriptional regulator, CsgD family n=1 Tax=Succiniclasticum ruminis TaxID=40841 RepID=A0A1G6NY75_9FIRM|nr:LuxR C-terminal-related transcriptional regulator [Succiniclasticum ruminis]SDC72990.1 DNA-binding transcriptional regulator, CsgD family [Succiniclasticum ruminis]